MKRIESSKPPSDGKVDIESELGVFLKKRKLQCASLVRCRALVDRERRDFELYLAQGEFALRLREEELPRAETVDLDADSFEICSLIAARDFVRSQLNHRGEFTSKVQIQLYGCVEDSQVAALVRAIFSPSDPSRGKRSSKEEEPVHGVGCTEDIVYSEEEELEEGEGPVDCSEEENKAPEQVPGTYLAYQLVTGCSRSAASYGLVNVDLNLVNWSKSFEVARRNGSIHEPAKSYLYLQKGAIKFEGVLDFDPEIVRRALPHVDAAELRSVEEKEVHTEICTEIKSTSGKNP
jgi:hypothetical protein